MGKEDLLPKVSEDENKAQKEKDMETTFTSIPLKMIYHIEEVPQEDGETWFYVVGNNMRIPVHSKSSAIELCLLANFYGCDEFEMRVLHAIWCNAVVTDVCCEPSYRERMEKFLQRIGAVKTNLGTEETPIYMWSKGKGVCIDEDLFVAMFSCLCSRVSSQSK